MLATGVGAPVSVGAGVAGSSFTPERKNGNFESSEGFRG